MTIEDVYASLMKKIRDIQASGGGVSDYGDLSNKPKINGVILNGSKTSGELELVNYSMQEQLIGRWADGRLLYEKVIDFGTLPNNAEKSVPHGIDNVGTIWIYDGYVSSGSTFYGLELPSEFKNIPSENKPYAWRAYVTKTDVVIESFGDKSSFNAIAVLRYTKISGGSR